MPTWNVQGADRASGADITRTIEAENAEDARRKIGRSMLVTSIEMAEEAAFDYVAIQQQQQERQTGAESPRSPTGAPGYDGIVVGATMLRVLGLAMVVLGILLGLASLGEAKINFSLLTCGAIASYGLFLFFIGSLGLAIRDIARNSFRH